MGSKRETSIALEKWKPSREIGGYREMCGYTVEKWKPREIGGKRVASIVLEKWKPSREVGG